MNPVSQFKNACSHPLSKLSAAVALAGLPVILASSFWVKASIPEGSTNSHLIVTGPGPHFAYRYDTPSGETCTRNTPFFQVCAPR
ncbi:MAG: hypothetical protein RBR86_07860 [Pseudobdellovibrionaceae bacterium]|jgi:hypothetical protein|nr:hypothetical protein [Pseudobdellovibrionaceae bacterium]